MKFDATMDDTLPPLGWYASIATNGVEVVHGRRVEVGDGWVVEGVWDGTFSEGGFADTEAFWGSGLKVREESVELVPSVALTDRIFLGTHGNGCFASNSLPIFLGRSGLRLRRDRSYLPQSYVLKEGVIEYDPHFPVDGNAQALQLFHQNVSVTRTSISRRLRSKIRHFNDFDAYYNALKRTVDRVADNLQSSDRAHPMRPLATVSSGYDSACTAVLARRAGAATAYTVESSNSYFPSFVWPTIRQDSGVEIAAELGLKAHILPSIPSDREIHFRSASCIRPELELDGVADHLGDQVGVLFTGFYGDTMWRRIPEPGGPDSVLKWPNPSGVSLSEGRLAGTFVNLALPFLFGRSRHSIRAISESQEMSPWSVGGDYDRPIPRRILEEEGVPREAFGIRKKAIVSASSSPVNPQARHDYYKWLHDSRNIHPGTYRMRELISTALFYGLAPLQVVGKHLGWKGTRTAPEELWPDELKPLTLMFHWAATTLAHEFSSS